MARFKSSTFGQISGKHGDAVAAVRKDGVCILKVYRVASNPNTVGQKNQRSKFGFVMKELNCLRKIFTYTYGGQYGINKAVSHAMKSAVIGDHSNFVLDFSKVLIAPNSFHMPILLTLSTSAPSKLNIVWSAALCTENQKRAMLNIVVLQPATKQVNHYENIVRFNAELAEVELPYIWENKLLHVWLYLSPINSGAIQGQYIGYVENNNSLSL